MWSKLLIERLVDGSRLEDHISIWRENPKFPLGTVSRRRSASVTIKGCTTDACVVCMCATFLCVCVCVCARARALTGSAPKVEKPLDAVRRSGSGSVWAKLTGWLRPPVPQWTADEECVSLREKKQYSWQNGGKQGLFFCFNVLLCNICDRHWGPPPYSYCSPGYVPSKRGR